MKIAIDIPTLRKNRLFVATPMYNSVCYASYFQSMLSLQKTFFEYNIPLFISNISNESLVMRARNYLVDEFLRTDCTHLLFIDADISFDPLDVLTLLHLDKDVIGAPYSLKSINWSNIKDAVKSFPDIDPNELHKFGGRYVFNTSKPLNLGEINEVNEIGTGFMMIKRDVFTKLIQHYPQLKYKPDHITTTHFNGSRYIHAFFHCIIDNFHDNILHNCTDRYLSEDYTFCQLWRKIGGSIFIAPWISLNHIGNYVYNCNVSSINLLQKST